MYVFIDKDMFTYQDIRNSQYARPSQLNATLWLMSDVLECTKRQDQRRWHFLDALSHAVLQQPNRLDTYPAIQVYGYAATLWRSGVKPTEPFGINILCSNGRESSSCDAFSLLSNATHAAEAHLEVAPDL